MADITRETEQLNRELEEIIARLPMRSPIYLPTEKIPLPQQVAGLRAVEEINRDRLKMIYAPRLRALKAQYRGRKRAFIIGNGPSLLKTDLTALKDEVTFAVNGFFLKIPDLNWMPTFYCVEDHLVAEDRADAINTLRGPTKLFPSYLGYCINEAADTVFFNHRSRKSYPHGFDFSMDVSEITYTGCTVTNTVMQIAHYLGFRELYLIGVDASYDLPADVEQASDYNVGVLDMKSDDVNHFHPDYFGKGYRWHDPQVEMMVQAYGEAERTTRKSGRMIYNATVGGKLEVFQRIDFYDVLPNARREHAAEPDDTARVAALTSHPRLLTIDMTRAGDGTATGEIKKMLLRRWPKEKFMQAFSVGASGIGLAFSVDGSTWSADPVSDAELNARIAAFRPETILYRPLADKPALHDAAMRIIRELEDRPVAIWIMDDWMERLAQSDPARFEPLDDDLRELIGRAAALFAISAPMAAALAARYGGEWQVFSNAIDPADWPEPAVASLRNDELLIRYAGGLADDMTLDSLRDIAAAVDDLAGSHAIRLEINTRDFWARRAGHHFDGMRNVSVTTETMPERGYREWLSGADAVLIAYNFDPATEAYVRYSMANKMPECLASGAVPLVYGPARIATVGYLAGLDCAEVITERDETALRTRLVALASDPVRRAATVASARAHAFAQHDLTTHGERFRQAIVVAAATGQIPAATGSPPVPTGELAPILRELGQLRAEAFAGWIGAVEARPAEQPGPDQEMAKLQAEVEGLGAALVRMRREVVQAQQDSARDQKRGSELVLRQIASLVETIRQRAEPSAPNGHPIAPSVSDTVFDGSLDVFDWEPL